MSTIVGIDLGTTNSLCAVFADGAPRLVPNALGHVLTPSVVGLLPDERVVVGAAARELAVLHPDRACACFKRWMGTDRTVTLGRTCFSAQELSSLVLRALKEDAEQHLGCPVEQAVITVPAYFNDHQREATRLAGKLAGLEVRRIVNEPTAAALTYGLLDKGADKRLLVFDLGGGTFDVTLMEVFEGTLEIVATAGESHLGGEDFTDRVVQWALQRHGLQLEVVEVREPLRVARLRGLAEDAKRTLGVSERAVLRLPRADGTLDEECPVLELGAAELAELTRPLMERLTGPLARVLRDGRVGTGQVDEVILAGGATRMPAVRSLVAEYFGREPLCSLDPDEVVARGAAVQAALIAADAAVDDLVATDVCPFTLGVEIVKQFGPRQRAGYFLPVIHRNTTVPVSREELVSTVQDNQDQVDVRVFQGESRKVEENLLLGHFTVTGIPPGPAGQVIALRFTYDINGLLEVEAVVEATGAKTASVFTNQVANLGREQIERAVANLQRLKFYPREDLGNRRLLLFAERVLGQVPPFLRSSLEAALDAYEAALNGNDREVFGAARSGLLLCLGELDHPYDEQRGAP